MKAEFATLAHIPLAPGATCVQPIARQRHTSMDAPATEVMTDLREIWAVTTTMGARIDDALEHMKRFGVRLLFVADEDAGREIVGIITANDVQGERPVQLVRESGLVRAELTVGQLMTPQSAIEVLSLRTVRNSQVGHIVQTLHAMQRQHALVVEMDESSGAQVIRGIFSTTEIGKRLGRDVTEVMSGAHSFAEIHQELGSGG